MRKRNLMKASYREENHFNTIGRVELRQTRTCKPLKEAGVLEAWPIGSKKEGEEKPKAINGFFRVSEKKLNSLSKLAIVKLRNAGALSVGYGKIFSVAHIFSLVQVADKKKFNYSYRRT